LEALERFTKTILLRCTAAVEFGLRLLPQGRCSFGIGIPHLGSDATAFSEMGYPNSSVNVLGRHFEVGSAGRLRFALFLVPKYGKKGQESEIVNG
jgi:hypothetical protein